MKLSGVIALGSLLFALGCGRDRPTGASPEVVSGSPAQPQNSKINVDTFGCRTIELSSSAFEAMANKKPLPDGCFDLEPLTRVQGPFDRRTVLGRTLVLGYVLIDVPGKGKLWVLDNHVDTYPDSVEPSPLGQPIRVTAEEFVLAYNRAQYDGEQVIVTGVAQSANSQRIEMLTDNGMTLELSSSGSAGVADFPPVGKGQKVTIECTCIGKGLGKASERFFLNDCSIMPAADR